MATRAGTIWRLAASTGLVLALAASTARLALADLPTAGVESSQYDPALRHNIPNLTVPLGGRTLRAPFRDHFLATGGEDRWGRPTSEVLEEEPGALVQYYQRGVLEWHAHESCGTPTGYCIQRQLAWDYFGGGRGGSPDLGVEPGLFNPNLGRALGPWGHRVSNLSVEGEPITFLDFFDRLGGVEAFGYPKTDARYDDRPDVALRSGDRGHRIRQYFQTAVFEWHGDEPPQYRVQLSLLGDDLRDLRYPAQAWKAFRSFRDAPSVAPGQVYEIERTVAGALREQARVAAANRITERCPAATWAAGAPFCPGPAGYAEVAPAAPLFTGDLVRTRNASPDFNLAALFEMVRATVSGPVVNGYAVAATDAGIALGPNVPGGECARVEYGDVGFESMPGADCRFAAAGVVLDPTSTLFLVSVRRMPNGLRATTVKVRDGALTVRTQGRAGTLGVGTNEQVQIVEGQPPPAAATRTTALTDRERAQESLLRQLRGRLGRPRVVELPAMVRLVPDALAYVDCDSRKTTTVGNAGGGQLDWRAVPSDRGITVQPQSGTLVAGRTQSVEVVLASGQGGSVRFMTSGGDDVVALTYRGTCVG